MKWSCTDKSFALSLMHSSPKTYRLLRKVFNLPSVSMLKLAMKNINVKPGFNCAIITALAKKLSNTPVLGKVVSISIDEMSIKEGLTYDSSNDLIEGFSWGLEMSNELANHAIVFMAKGIIHSWKQPLGYFLSSGPMSGNDMKPLLLDCIRSLVCVYTVCVYTIHFISLVSQALSRFKTCRSYKVLNVIN